MAVVSDYTALLEGVSWNGSLSEVPTQSVIITYSFSTVAQSYLSAAGYSQSFINSFGAFSETEKSQARTALDAWANACGIIFVEVAAGEGTIQFGNFDLTLGGGSSSTAGFAYQPYTQIWKDYGGYSGNSFIASDHWYGDVFISASYAGNPSNSSDVAHVIIHEIGHALGLKHPFDGTTTLSAGLDNGNQTVMSYNSPRNSTLGPLDIQAVQAIYGTNAADMSHLAAYSFDAVTNTLTQVGLDTSARILGNYGKDVINGNGGNDTLAGMEGNDLLFGGSGDDLVFGNEGNDTFGGGLGNDQYFGGTGYSEVASAYYDILDYSFATSALSINLSFHQTFGGIHYHAVGAEIGYDYIDGIDQINCGAGADSITSGSDGLAVTGGGGNDTLIGNASAIDTAIFSTTRAVYTVAKSGTNYVVTDNRGAGYDGTDQLSSVERMAFGGVVMGSEAFTPVSFGSDLKSDLLWTSTSGQATVFQMNGTTVTTATGIGGTNGATWRVKAAADLNGDGKSDIIWQDTSGLVVAYIMNGTSVSSAVVIGNATAAFTVAGTGDLNGDGMTDIVVQDTSGVAVGWLMNGSTIASAGAIGGANGATWSVKTLGDINADGRADLIWQDTSGRVTAYQMNGLSVTSAALLTGANGTDFSIKGAGDLNGDGTGDIVWQYANGQAGAFLMNGLSIAGAGTIGGANGSQYEVRDVSDLNGDSKMDLVWENTSNGQAVGFLMNGTTITSAGNIGGANGSQWLVV